MRLSSLASAVGCRILFLSGGSASASESFGPIATNYGPAANPTAPYLLPLDNNLDLIDESVERYDPLTASWANLTGVRRLAEDAKTPKLAAAGLHFSVYPESCKVTPDVNTAPSSRYFSVECPEEVESIRVDFTTEGSDSAKSTVVVPPPVYDKNGYVLTKRTYNLDAGDSVREPVRLCDDVSDASTCVTFQIEIRRLSTHDAPQLTHLTISHSPSPIPAFDPKVRTLNVTLYANEPVTVEAAAPVGTFVTNKKPRAESGATDGWSIFDYVPTSESPQKFKIYVVDGASSLTGNYTVNVSTVTSTNPQLAAINVNPGRLEPAFHSSTYVYYLRVPEGSRSVTVSYTPINNVDTTCAVNGNTMGRSSQSTTVALKSLFSDDTTKVIRVVCKAADERYTAAYSLAVIEQKGGSTRLKALDVIGAEMRPEFAPEYNGPYVVDLGFQGKEDLKWIGIVEEPMMPTAIVKIDNQIVPNERKNVVWYRVDSGEKRDFEITVSTVDNPTSETYKLSVDRTLSTPAMKQTSALGRLFAYSTAAASASHSGPAFLNNLKFLQYLSLSNRINGQPERLQYFTREMHPFNFQYNLCPNSIKLKDDLGRTVRPESGALLDSNSTASTLVNGHVVRSSESTPVAPLSTSDAAALLARAFATTVSLNHKPEGAADWTQKYSKEEMFSLTDSELNKAVGAANPTDVQVAMSRMLSQVQADPQSSRQLLRLDPNAQHKLISRLDAAYNEQNKKFHYASSVVFISAGLLVTAVTYSAVWLLYLRSPTDVMALRQDYPLWLHPSKFWTFILDAAFIAYTQACVGLMAYANDKSTSIVIFGYEIAVKSFFWFSLFTVLLYPVAFLAIGVFFLFQIKKNMVWSDVLHQYHDKVCYEGSARSNRFPWLPAMFRHFFDFEVSGVVPLCRPRDQEGTPSIAFSADTTPTTGPWFESDPSRATGQSRDVESGWSQGGGVSRQNYQALIDGKKMRTLEYDPITDRVRVELFEEEDDSFAWELYEAYAKRHPDAMLAYDEFQVMNSYDWPLKVDVEVQLKHLPMIVHTKDHYCMWMPREHLRLPRLTAFGGMLYIAQRGSFFNWGIERAVTFALIVAVNSIADPAGFIHKVLFTIAAATLFATFVPGAIYTGASKWASLMDSEIQNAEAKRKKAKNEEEALSTWPFNEMNARQKLRRDHQRDDLLWCGLYGYYNSLIGKPIKQFTNYRLFKTRAFVTLKEIIFGPVMTEAMKVIFLFTLFIGSGNTSSSFVHTSALFIVALAALCLNKDSLKEVWADAKNFAAHTASFFRNATIDVYNAMCDLPNMGDRMKHYVGQVVRTLSGEKNVSFRYPGRVDMITMRDDTVRDVVFIENELGLQMKGRICFDEQTKSKKYMNCLLKNRYDMTKTICRFGAIGASRPISESVLPIQLSFRQFSAKKHHLAKENVSRLAATIQVVNHSSLRFPHAKQWRDSQEDDSFLSLYTDPALVPPMGNIRCRPQHGYAVHYDPELNQLTIKGPAIKEGAHYRIMPDEGVQKTAQSLNMRRDSTASAASVPEESAVSSPRVQESVHAEGYCIEAGVLRVRGQQLCAPPQGQTIHVAGPKQDFQIDTAETEVTFNKKDRELKMISRYFLPSESLYRVEWKCNVDKAQVAGSGVAHDVGTLCVQLSGGGPPDLTRPFILQDDERVCVSVDPAETDAYCTAVPSRFFTGATHGAATIAMCVKRNMKQITGMRSEVPNDFPELVPCTIVQCLDPIRGTFRVEPNFVASLRTLNASLEHVQAKLAALDDPACLGRLAASVIPPDQFAKFFTQKGVKIDEENRLINPLVDTEHALVRAKNREIQKIEPTIRAEVERRLRNERIEIQRRIGVVREWTKAYSDPELAAAQHRRDMSECRPVSEGEILLNVSKLKSLKQPYEFRIPNFVYPLNVDQTMLCRKPNLDAQFNQWRRTVESWLYEEETSAWGDFATTDVRVNSITDRIVNAVTDNFTRVDDATVGEFKSAMHLMVDSLSVRGKDVNWRPDPIAATDARLRVFLPGPNGTPDFTKETWIPCGLKLTANAVRITMQNDDDLQREFDDSQKHWRHISGYYIPLQCFEKIDVVHSPLSDAAKQTLDLSGCVDTEIVFRKNQEMDIDDEYVRRIEDGVFENDINLRFDDTGECLKYSIMIGHCVTPDEAKQWLTTEVDRSITGGGKVNLHPLTFRCGATMLEKWRDVISAGKMDQRPREMDRSFDGAVRKASSSFTSVSPRHEASSVSSPSSALDTARSPEPITPPASARYEGEYVNCRFHGVGSLYDEEGCVYTGEWGNGQRWGKGTCIFKDHRGIKWKYEGNFEQDEICGPGRLVMIDERELQRLAATGDDPWAVVSLEGTFDPPRHLRARRRPSCPPVAEYPKIAPELLKQVIHESREAVAPSSSSASSSDHVDIIIDVRRAQSASGNEGILGCKMGQLGEHYGEYGARASSPYRKTVEKAPVGSTSSLSSSDSASHNARSSPETASVVDEYLPHVSRWLRMIDPNLGYQTVPQRLRKGTAKYACGASYDGKLLNGKPSGRGFFDFPAKTLKYDGAWFEGVPHGKGAMTWTNDGHDFRHVGEFSKGSRQGPGVLDVDRGKAYMEANWKKDVPSNGKKGLLHFERTLAPKVPIQRYKGGLQSGVPEGEGTMIWHDKSMFVGHFKEGKRQGKGTLTDHSGSAICVGNFDKDLPNGHVARMVCPKGEVYCGDVVKGQRQGMGELYSSDGTMIYEGFWFGDEPCGRGTLWCPDGQYEGEFKDGKRSGKGTFTYKESGAPNGRPRQYEGDWVNDQQQGVGKYTNEDGKTLTYKFREGQITGDSAKAYSKGICRRAPKTSPVPTKVERVSFSKFSKDHWTKNYGVESKTLAAFIAAQSGGKPWADAFSGPLKSQTAPTSMGERPVRTPITRPPSPVSTSGRRCARPEILTVVLHEGKNFSLAEGTSMNPFVHIKIGSKSKDTEVIANGGPNTNFKDAKLKFFIDRQNAAHRSVKLQAWSQDESGRLILIGNTQFDLAKMMSQNQTSATRELALTRKKENCGLLKATFTLAPYDNTEMSSGRSSSESHSLVSQNRAPSSAVSHPKDVDNGIKVAIHSAKGLYAVREKMDPYCRVTVGGNTNNTRRSKGGGSNPQWVGEVLAFPYKQGETITIEMFHREERKLYMIGKGELVPSEKEFSDEVALLRASHSGGPLTVPAGKVSISYQVCG